MSHVGRRPSERRTTIRTYPDDVELAFRRTGAGAPLLLLHGGWSDSASWQPQLSSLADGFDVIAPDLPGCGGSEDLPGTPSLDAYADAVAGLLADLRLDRVHVAGLSFGGGLALAIAQGHPGVVRSLVLVSAYAGWAGSLAPDKVAARLQAVRTGPLPVGVRRRGQVAMAEAFAVADLRPGLADIAVPTLVLTGEHDIRAPRPVAQALHDAIPGSRLVVVPDAGHEVALEAPEAFDREIRAFLAEKH